MPAPISQPYQQPAPVVNPPINPMPSVGPSAQAPIKPEENLAVGDEYSKAIARLMEMGFPREECAKAMKAAYNNTERATEFLLSVNSFVL